MNSPAVHNTLSSSLTRVSSLSNASLIGQAFTASQAAPKHSRKQQLTHSQFWLDISKIAAQHSCGVSDLKRQLCAVRSHDSSGEEPSSSGRACSDLLIVGPGVLGSLIGKLWTERQDHAAVVGQTNTETNHDRLRALGIIPRLKQDTNEDLFPNVIFSAPPSGSKDYVAEVKGALKKWDQRGTFIFTSSSGVMNPTAGEKLTEDTALHTVGTSDRLDRLLKCEEAVLEAGGCVARFVGLYHAKRGAHMFFLRQGAVERWGGHIVNLIHYEDAAEFCLKILEGGSGHRRFRSEVFFGTDCAPLSFQEMMDATMASGLFEGSCKFVGSQESEPSGGSSNAATQEALHWSPKYTSFKEFIDSGAQDIFETLP